MDGEQRAPHVDTEGLIDLLLRDVFQWRDRGSCRVSEDHVQTQAPRADGVLEPVQVGQARNVTRDGSDPRRADGLHGRLQL